MSIELVGGGMLCAIGLLMIVYLARRAERSKVTKVRVLTRAANEIQKCWGVLEKLPAGYLPASMRRMVVRLLEYTVGTTLRLDPDNPYFREQDARAKQLVANLGNDHNATSRPVLMPSDRKEVAARLRDLRRLTSKAQDRGLIADSDSARQQLVIDSMLLRIMVDHLKQNAFNSETVAHPEEAIRYLVRALEALSMANEGGRYSEELASINGEVERMRERIRAEAEKRRGSEPNRLLNAMQKETKKAEADARRALFE